ncbi:putative Fe-S cluster assembly protein SufT [Allohahella sp. A8]|uniref:putative Fe-S cluster assembly protein SufT n=1 Tax=Allohahella sp. A8 TaxID=3141461 RepID=UPI000C0B1159|nr:putative Fe-S cluster assembly protein SufT [Hahellaceae bacterium]|tara:strand:+ start:1305 stop:1847 length:543 start_codon:yes stop_codon:yes gene_type:complete
MALEREVVLTKRPCIARQVPDGTEIEVPADVFVTITQALGGSFTIVYNGNMARIEAKDADALGKSVFDFEFSEPVEGEVSEAHVWDALAAVYDPEIPVNIVDLGLIYRMEIQQTGDENIVEIDMTLTAPGCGMGPVIADDVKSKVSMVPNVDRVDVKMIFDPPWDNDRMSEVAKLELGML